MERNKPYWFQPQDMALHSLRLLLAIAILLVLSSCNGESAAATKQDYDTALFNRSSFPAGFVFGTASAAFQVGD